MNATEPKGFRRRCTSLRIFEGSKPGRFAYSIYSFRQALPVQREGDTTGKNLQGRREDRTVGRYAVDEFALEVFLFINPVIAPIKKESAQTLVKINTKDIPEEFYDSPKGKYGGGDKEISIALGRKPSSTDLQERHPFDVQLSRIPPGKSICPYHSHSAQWEFYHIISGNGIVRHEDGTTEIEPGDAFIFEPGQPHQLLNQGPEDLIVFIVADNPVGESCYYPDSHKWLVRSPGSRLMRSEPLDYYDGEE